VSSGVVCCAFLSVRHRVGGGMARMACACCSLPDYLELPPWCWLDGLKGAAELFVVLAACPAAVGVRCLPPSTVSAALLIV
jgi:hypothetical protein